VSVERIPCAICGGTETRVLYTKHSHEIARCTKCGLVYANPRASASAILARYGADYFWKEYLPALGVVDGRYDLARFDARYAPLLQLLNAAPARRLLEVGSGAGFFLKAAERAGWRVAGIELSDEASRFARERLGLDVRRERAESITMPPGTFGAAAMFDTIEHLFDPGAVLRSLAEALVPGGTLLVSTPNFNALSRHVLGPDWAVLSPLEHLYYFEERTLAALLEVCGFDDVRFVREHAAWTPQETMNYRYTHAPDGLRARACGLLARAGGRTLARALQLAGRQDILLCTARRTE
jgi:SAM-dependent methyltransferase